MSFNGISKIYLDIWQITYQFCHDSIFLLKLIFEISEFENEIDDDINFKSYLKLDLQIASMLWIQSTS